MGPSQLFIRPSVSSASIQTHSSCEATAHCFHRGLLHLFTCCISVVLLWLVLPVDRCLLLVRFCPPAIAIPARVTSVAHSDPIAIAAFQVLNLSQNNWKRGDHARCWLRPFKTRVPRTIAHKRAAGLNTHCSDSTTT